MEEKNNVSKSRKYSKVISFNKKNIVFRRKKEKRGRKVMTNKKNWTSCLMKKWKVLMLEGETNSQSGQ